MQFSDWVQLIFVVFLALAFAIWFTLKFMRELRYQKDDDQYIP